MTTSSLRIENVEWRPARIADIDAIVALQDACFEADGGYREVASEIADRFESPMVESVEDDTLLGVVDDYVIVSLWSLVVPEGSDAWNVYDDNYIHPDHRTDEIVGFALDWWEQRAVVRLAGKDDGLPICYHQHVYERQQSHTAIIEARGYTPAVYFDELIRDLSAPIPDLPVPDGLRLVNHSAVPPEQALALRNEAFADHRGSQPFTLEMWKSRESEFSRPDASFAILDEDDRPVSYAFCAAYPHDAADKGYTEGWIEGVGTARSHRGRGLASIVICEAMQVFAREGLDYATLGVDTENPTGAAGLYANLGFERADGYVEYTKTVEREVRDDG